MTRSYVWHDAFGCVPWHVHMCDMTHSDERVCHDTFICVTWLIRVCDMTHSYVRRVSTSYMCQKHTHTNESCHTYERVMFVTPMHCDVTHSYVWHDAFLSVIWLMSHIWMSHVIHINESCHTYEWAMLHIWISLLSVTWLIYMCDMTHSYVWHDSFICVTWRIHMCDMTNSYVWHAVYFFFDKSFCQKKNVTCSIFL